MEAEAERACQAYISERTPLQLVWTVELSTTACQAAAEGCIDVLAHLEKVVRMDDDQPWVP